METVDHGMKFWERQANALRSTLAAPASSGPTNCAAPPKSSPKYSQLEYFEMTTSALRTLMIEKGYMTEQELQAKMEEIRARFNVPDETESPDQEGGEAQMPAAHGSGGRRASTYAPAPGHRFNVGDACG